MPPRRAFARRQQRVAKADAPVDASGRRATLSKGRGGPNSQARRPDAGLPCDDDAMEAIAAHLDAIPHTELLSAAQIARLMPVDQAVDDAGLLGANPAGLYQPAAKEPPASASAPSDGRGA